MNQSPSIGELAKALAAAQGEIKGAVKDTANPFFKSKYADLASVWDACRAALSTHGLSVVQMPGDFLQGEHGAMVTLTTTLLHESGEWLSETMQIPVAQAGPQAAGSALTYARRYSLAAFVGVAPEDDDGNSAASPTNGPEKKTAADYIERGKKPVIDRSGPAKPAAKEDRIMGLQRRAKARIQQLAAADLIPRECLQVDAVGQIRLEKLRHELVKDAQLNLAGNEDEWRKWVDALDYLWSSNQPIYADEPPLPTEPPAGFGGR